MPDKTTTREKASDELHPPVGVDQTRFLSFGDVARRVVIERGLPIRDLVLGAAVFRQPLLPDALDGCRFLRGQRRPAAVIASHGHLPLFSGGCDTDDVRALPIEVGGGARRSLGSLAPAEALDIAGAA